MFRIPEHSNVPRYSSLYPTSTSIVSSVVSEKSISNPEVPRKVITASRFSFLLISLPIVFMAGSDPTLISIPSNQPMIPPGSKLFPLKLLSLS